MAVDRLTRDLSAVAGSVLHAPLWFYWVEHGDDLFAVCASSVADVDAVVQERAALRAVPALSLRVWRVDGGVLEDEADATE